MSVREQFYNKGNVKAKNTYEAVLPLVQAKVKETHADMIANNDAEAIRSKLIQIITQIIIDEGMEVAGHSTEQLAKRIYNDMAGAGFLFKYIFETPNVEEVNINRWDDVTVTYSGGVPEKTPERFNDAQHAIDVVRRLLQMQSLTIDNSTPDVLSYLADGVRISANVHPIMSKDAAISASIRVVRPDSVTFDNIVELGTATQEMTDFLRFCVEHHISIVMSGSTGAGKTTTMSAILRCAKDTDRIVTIEEGSRELDLVKRDPEGNIINNVLSKITRDSDNPDLRRTAEQLLEHALRENPDILAMGEMRSSEAYTVAEAARTGTAVYTTTHAKDGFNTYRRIMELSYKKYPMDIDFLMQQMVEAFPIVCFQRKYPDGTRRISEIVEGVSYDDKKRAVTGRVLYKYVVEDNIINDEGKIIDVKGRFEKVDDMSENLVNLFLTNGATLNEINRFMKKGV